MARKRIEIVSSDLTGKEISKPEEVAEVRVLSHPLLDGPVRLDAYVLEVANLESSRRDLVTIELVLPNTPPEQLVLDRETFDGLFTSDVQEVLSSADSYEDSGSAAAGKRRGRSGDGPAKSFSATPSVNREQREAIRTWANANGFTVGDRGRIAANITQAFEAAHQS
jgi:hypothetical protein